MVPSRGDSHGIWLQVGIVRYYDVALEGLLGLSGNGPNGACRAEQGHVCEARLS